MLVLQNDIYHEEVNTTDTGEGEERKLLFEATSKQNAQS